MSEVAIQIDVPSGATPEIQAIALLAGAVAHVEQHYGPDFKSQRRVLLWASQLLADMLMDLKAREVGQ